MQDYVEESGEREDFPISKQQRVLYIMDRVFVYDAISGHYKIKVNSYVRMNGKLRRDWESLSIYGEVIKGMLLHHEGQSMFFNFVFSF